MKPRQGFFCCASRGSHQIPPRLSPRPSCVHPPSGLYLHHVPPTGGMRTIHQSFTGHLGRFCKVGKRMSATQDNYGKPATVRFRSTDQTTVECPIAELGTFVHDDPQGIYHVFLLDAQGQSAGWFAIHGQEIATSKHPEPEKEVVDLIQSWIKKW